MKPTTGNVSVVSMLFAALATLLLGLDHVNLLFNRLALPDTPAALGAVCAFYAFVRGTKSPDNPPGKRARIPWLVVCGLIIVGTLANRTLCAYLIPVPFLAIMAADRQVFTRRLLCLA